MSEPLAERLMSSDPLAGLELAWTSADLTLAERVRVVSHLHAQSRMTIAGTARMMGGTAVEVQALLELAALDDGDLDLVSTADAPPTTWLLFAGADQRAIRAGVEALSVVRNDGVPPAIRVYEAMKLAVGPTLDERISSIPGSTLSHLAKKSKQYGALADRPQKFLASVAAQKKTGKVLTEKQLVWLKSVLFDLVDAGVVSPESIDGDQSICDEVLSALALT